MTENLLDFVGCKFLVTGIEYDGRISYAVNHFGCHAERRNLGSGTYFLNPVGKSVDTFRSKLLLTLPSAGISHTTRAKRAKRLSPYFMT